MKFLALILTVFSMGALADGIPVPLNQQTPYNWKCAYDTQSRAQASLHLFVERVTSPTVYVHIGGSVGVKVPQVVVKALLSQNYQAIDGQTFLDNQFHRSLSFDVQGKELFVKMQDGGYKMIVSNCRATFSPVR